MIMAQQSATRQVASARNGQNGGFVDRPLTFKERLMVLDDVFLAGKVSPLAMRVAWALNGYCSATNICVWPNQAAIAKRLRASREGVTRAIAELAEQGYIKVRSSDCPCGRGGLRRGNHYQFRGAPLNDPGYYEGVPDYPDPYEGEPWDDEGDAPNASGEMPEDAANVIVSSHYNATPSAHSCDETVTSNVTKPSPRTIQGNSGTPVTPTTTSSELPPGTTARASINPAPKPAPQKPKRSRGLSRSGGFGREPIQFRETSSFQQREPEFPLPPNWLPTEEQILVAIELGVPGERMDSVVGKFRDWHHGHAIKAANWDKLWSKWCRTEVEHIQQRASRPRSVWQQQRDRLLEIQQNPGLGGKVDYSNRF